MVLSVNASGSSMNSLFFYLPVFSKWIPFWNQSVRLGRLIEEGEQSGEAIAWDKLDFMHRMDNIQHAEKSVINLNGQGEE